MKNMHYSVLLNESIALLAIKADGVYVDATFGRGGHSLAILAKLNQNGRLIALDKDPQAVSYGQQSITDSRFTLIHSSFACLQQCLLSLGISQVDGVLFDLGVSSPQLDEAERGFSFRLPAVLDMRMDNSVGRSAGEWLSSAGETEIADVLWRYGEERFARKIARLIIDSRMQQPISTTTQLAKLISDNIYTKDKTVHVATRTFQGIRIFINNELGDLEQLLLQLPNLLKVGATVVAISFHSLEDRMVKQAFNNLVSGTQLPKWVMVVDKPATYKIIAKKIKASPRELQLNRRSRSAVLRGLEKLA